MYNNFQLSLDTTLKTDDGEVYSVVFAENNRFYNTIKKMVSEVSTHRYGFENATIDDMEVSEEFYKKIDRETSFLLEGNALYYISSETLLAAKIQFKLVFMDTSLPEKLGNGKFRIGLSHAQIFYNGFSFTPIEGE